MALILFKMSSDIQGWYLRLCSALVSFRNGMYWSSKLFILFIKMSEEWLVSSLCASSSVSQSMLLKSLVNPSRSKFFVFLVNMLCFFGRDGFDCLSR